jgi:hypothetical protein
MKAMCSGENSIVGSESTLQSVSHSLGARENSIVGTDVNA